MEREQILRDDFQTVRKGWDPDEVRDHLRAVANGANPEAEAPLADAAAERVRSVIAAAEEVAAEIRAETRAEADGLLASARAESERIVERAREVANERVEQARAAVEGLVSQADELRNRVGTLGEELTGNIRSSGAVPSAEVPGPIIVPEPSPPTIPEPTPDPVPEPTPDPTPDPPMPDPVPEPTPDPVPDPTPDPGIDPQPPVPDPGPEPPQPAAASKASTEDLIAQLKGGASTAPVNGSGEPSAPGSDLAAARLVTMNMALEGSSREQISARISSEFGGLDDLDGMLDDVLARAGR